MAHPKGEEMEFVLGRIECYLGRVVGESEKVNSE